MGKGKAQPTATHTRASDWHSRVCFSLLPLSNLRAVFIAKSTFFSRSSFLRVLFWLFESMDFRPSRKQYLGANSAVFRQYMPPTLSWELTDRIRSTQPAYRRRIESSRAGFVPACMPVHASMYHRPTFFTSHGQRNVCCDAGGARSLMKVRVS